jgi:uracil-DNA glycosylase
MDVKIEESWKEKLKNEFDKEYFVSLSQFVREEYRTRQVFPPGNRIFNAFNLCPFDMVKVVIIGQDPYHNTGQAHGLCFSVTDGTEFPSQSHQHIQRVAEGSQYSGAGSGNLERWAGAGCASSQCHTHSQGAGLSHESKGWERFTDARSAH